MVCIWPYGIASSAMWSIVALHGDAFDVLCNQAISWYIFVNPFTFCVTDR